jgi:hypothetical protein
MGPPCTFKLSFCGFSEKSPSATASNDGRPYRATILLVSCECLGTAIRAVQQIQQKPANASYRRTLIRSEFLPLLVQ